MSLGALPMCRLCDGDVAMLGRSVLLVMATFHQLSLSLVGHRQEFHVRRLIVFYAQSMNDAAKFGTFKVRFCSRMILYLKCVVKV